MRQERQVKSVILETIKKQKMLSAGILTAVIGAVVAALIPPLILAKIIDTVTAGNEAAFSVILLYFVLLALTGILEAARCVGAGQGVVRAQRRLLRCPQRQDPHRDRRAFRRRCRPEGSVYH